MASEKDSLIKKQINALVHDRITSKLSAHDAIMSTLTSEITSMLDSLTKIQSIHTTNTKEAVKEAKELKSRIEVAQQKAAQEAKSLATEKAAQKKQAPQKPAPPTARSSSSPPAPKRPPRFQYTPSTNSSKPRGRIVGKVIELSLDHVKTEEKERVKVTPTTFNAPRCAKVGKDDSTSLDQIAAREHQAASQVKYPQCRSVVYAPTSDASGVAKPMWELEEKLPVAPVPENKLEMDFVYGYHNAGAKPSARSNVFRLGTGETIYYSGTVVVISDLSQSPPPQNFFQGHNNEVTCIAVHSKGRYVASSQGGRQAPVYVWDTSVRRKGNKTLPDECHVSTLISKTEGHSRGVCSVDFSGDGKLLVSVGTDYLNTAVVWDWEKGVVLASVSSGGQPVFDMRFNPYQCYPLPDNPPVMGQAVCDDDAIYTLTSCGVRHVKFWVLLRSQDEHGDVERAKRWYLEGNHVNFATKTTVQDITCFTFIDDSPPLSYYDNSTSSIQTAPGTSDRSTSRVVAGTSSGDIFVFKQPAIQLRYKNDVEGVPWWMMSDDVDSSGKPPVMKRLYDSYATMIGIIPHDVASGNKYILPRKERDEIDRVAAKYRLQSHNVELKKKLNNLYYKGSVGHNGACTMLSFNKEANMLVSAGKDGKMCLWDPNMQPSLKESSQSTSGMLTEIGVDNEGVDLASILHNGAAGRSVCWSDSNAMVVGTSTNSILEIDVDTESRTLGSVKERVCSHFGVLSGLAMHPSKPLFVTVGRDRSVNLWLSDSFSCVSQARLSASATSVCFSDDGKAIAIGLVNFEFVILEVVDEGGFEYSLRPAFQKSVAPIKIEDADVAEEDEASPRGPSGRRGRAAAAAVEEDPNTKKTKKKSGRKEGRGNGALKDEVMDLKYSPDGLFLAIALRDNNIYVYSVGERKEDESEYRLVTVMKGHTSNVTNLDWSSDGKYIQSTAADAELLYWQIKGEGGEDKDFKPCQSAHPYLLRDMEWHSWTSVYGWPVQGIWPTDIETSDPVHGVMRSNRGEVVIVCDDVGRIRLMRWPSLPGDGKREYFGHAIHAWDAKFSGDDSTVVSIGGADCTVIQWKHVDGMGRRVRYDKEITPRRPTVMWTPKNKGAVGRRVKEMQESVVEEGQEERGGGGGGGKMEEEKREERKEEERGKKRRPSGKKNQWPRKVQALYDYEGQDDEELDLKKGEWVVVVSIEEGWYESDNGKMFPADYVEDGAGDK